MIKFIIVMKKHFKNLRFHYLLLLLPVIPKIKSLLIFQKISTDSDISGFYRNKIKNTGETIATDPKNEFCYKTVAYNHQKDTIAIGR